jgi:hypothetical protein
MRIYIYMCVDHTHKIYTLTIFNEPLMKETLKFMCNSFMRVGEYIMFMIIQSQHLLSSYEEHRRRYVGNEIDGRIESHLFVTFV